MTDYRKILDYCAQQWRAEKAASLLQESRPSDFGRMADSSSYPTGVLYSPKYP